MDTVAPRTANQEELQKLRFTRQVTAFDVDMEVLDDRPWRNRNVDLADYFNYGFNEDRWMVIALLLIVLFGFTILLIIPLPCLELL
jgi:hypothetical protein